MKVPLKKVVISKNDQSQNTIKNTKVMASNPNLKTEDKNNLYATCSPYDIILGKVPIRPDLIDDYLKILNNYENDCCKESRYVEAEMAKHKIEEIKKISKTLEIEKTINHHLKEKIEVEEAYLEEMAKFKLKWSKKQEKFDKKIEESKEEMIKHQKMQLREAQDKVEEKCQIMAKETNQKIANLQKIEKSLAQQRNYIEAQKAKDEWLLEKDKIVQRAKEESERRKAELMAEYELRSKQEMEEFVIRINELRINLESDRQTELDSLLTKYNRVKTQLSSIQQSEAKRMQTMKNFKVTDINQKNETIDLGLIKTPKKGSVIESKKKILLKQINRLNMIN